MNEIVRLPEANLVFSNTQNQTATANETVFSNTIVVNGIRYPISSFDNDSGNPFYDGAMYLQLGASNLGAGSDFYAPLTGQISNVALYEIELTNQQILQNYNSTKSRFSL